MPQSKHVANGADAPGMPGGGGRFAVGIGAEGAGMGRRRHWSDWIHSLLRKGIALVSINLRFHGPAGCFVRRGCLPRGGGSLYDQISCIRRVYRDDARPMTNASMSGQDRPPDESDTAEPAAESACPQCGGLRYRGPFGETCPRCLFLAIGEAVGEESSPRIPPDATEDAGAVRARRFGRFEVMLRPDGTWWELGRGTAGTTYRALDAESLAPAAVKILNPATEVPSGAPRPFSRWADEVAKLRHPNVARLLQAGVGADGSGFLAVELVEGTSLQQLVSNSGPQSVDLALEIAGQIAQALATAEEHGIIHGDLKPSNVVLAAGDELRPQVKVTDFGVAHWTNASFSGTAGFASPEQVAGCVLDARADFFALGAIAYYLLEARKAEFIGPGAEPGDAKRTARVSLSPLAERGIPDEVTAWLGRLLDSNPGRRPKDALELLDSIGAVRSRMKKATVASLASLKSESPTRWRRWFGGPSA